MPETTVKIEPDDDIEVRLLRKPAPPHATVAFGEKGDTWLPESAPVEGGTLLSWVKNVDGAPDPVLIKDGRDGDGAVTSISNIELEELLEGVF